MNLPHGYCVPHVLTAIDRRRMKGGTSMSDTSQGPGWWLASDGKWYPPQSATPPAASTPPPTAPPTAPMAAPPGQPQPPVYYAPVQPRNDGMAVAGLVCGITALPMILACGVGTILGILGVVFGILGMKRVERSGGTLTGRGMGLAGAICGGVAIAIFVAYVVIVIIISATNSN